MHFPKYFIALLFILMLVTGIRCLNDKAEFDHEYSISLRRVPSYQNESWEDVRTGLIWSFSFLGATLPAGSFNSSIRWTSDRIFICDLSRLGFSKEALEALRIIIEKIKATEEYRLKGGVDIGRFLMLTLYSTHHYYRITGMNFSLDEFKSKYISGNPLQFAVTNSGIAFNDRLIQMPLSPDLQNLFYMASEGNGSLHDSSFAEGEFEAFDFMSNGQLRFALFDIHGKLKSAGDTSLSIAGKPGKCMWCHESSVLPMYTINSDLPGYMTSQQFSERITHSAQQLKSHRESLESDVNYSNKQDHTKSELLYIGFMEPSAFRIAMEWGISVEQVQTILNGMQTHTYPEFSFLGNLYHRSAIDLLAPYSSERVPESAREPSAYEPDFFE
jgi:hypothetical protein